MNLDTVKSFLKDDYPRLDLITGGGTVTKLNLDNSDHLVYYQAVYTIVNTTIDNLENTNTNPYKKLIVERYVKHTKFKDLEISGYSHTTLHRKMNKALIAFGTEFNRLTKENKIDFSLQF